MTKLSEKQTQFLALIEAGATPRDAGIALGYRKGSIAWYWADKNPVFAKRFRDAWPPFGKNNPEKYQIAAAVIEKAPVLTVFQLAMQRLERELRVNGPNAVLAAAAIVLTSPQAAPVDSPPVEAETSNDADAVADDSCLLLLRGETPSMALSRMLNEVFPLNAPCTFSVDVGNARHHIERYYNCNLEVELQSSPKSISNLLRRHLTERFSIVFEPHLRSHGARIYAVPQPVTRA